MARVLDPRKQCLVCDGTGLIPWALRRARASRLARCLVCDGTGLIPWVFHGERPDGTALIWCEDVMCLSCEGRGTRCK